MAQFWRAEWDFGVKSVIRIQRTERNGPIIRRIEKILNKQVLAHLNIYS